MKRIAFALAVVAMAAACRQADQQPAQTDTTQMMGDTTKMMGDTSRMMAGDTAKRM